jgi:hypothetical protein
MVRWDPDRGQFTASDTSGFVLGASVDKQTAIGIARREAIATSVAGFHISVIVQEKDGTLRHEWTAELPRDGNLAHGRR